MKRVIAILAALIILGAIAWGLNSYQQRYPATATLVPPRDVSAQVIEVPLRISVDQAMNAAEFYFSFPADKLKVKEIKKDGSFFELWITGSPSFDNATGEFALAGGLPSPGFTGENGLIGTVVFEPLNQGLAEITFDRAKSRVLANDGLGTKIEARFTDLRLTLP